MRPWPRTLLTLAVVATLALPAFAQRRPPRTELTILTGAEGGTYHALARDIERLLEEVAGELGLDLDVVPSQGALQNVVDVFTHSTVPLAFAQLDLFEYFRYYAKTDARARQVVESMHVVLPLYDEEVHVLGRHTVTRLADLAGKRISIGEPGSGTSVTARVLLRLARIEPGKVEQLPAARAIEALRRGEIDAMVLVRGVPARDLAERMTPADRFVFLPIDIAAATASESLARVYRKGTIPAGTYPGQRETVETLTIRSGIGTSGPVSCEALGQLARAVMTHLPWLQEHGHPKWKSVRFDAAEMRALPRLSPCVARALGG
jgi:uncharacterized protein